MFVAGIASSPAQVTGGVQKAAPGEEKPVSASLSPFWVGQIKVLNGRASVVREGVRQEATIGTYLKQGDVVNTESTGSVGIVFNDNTALSAGPNSHVVIHRFSFDTTTYQGNFEANVVRGTVAVRPGQIARSAPESMRINTPASELRGHAAGYVVGVRGD
jgi:hypothetical protein